MSGHRIELVQGDITVQRVDAIVNAANSQLSHGGGVARAIAAAAGPSLSRESEAHAFVPVGAAGLTGAGALPCAHVIHAVGPRWSGGGSGEPELLAGAYRSSLLLAERIGARSVAFPSISTGVFGYPLRDAARIAVSTVRETLDELGGVELVRFCLFSEPDLDAYRAAAHTIAP
jgi:O-acetyl-ADP-ribose deacetylase (regulator of RNase III)